MSEKVISPGVYFIVYGALLLLTLLTVGVSFVDLGRWHLIVGLGIAAAKGALVILIFMHAWYSARLTWIMFAGGLFWFAILVAFTLSDYLTRSLLAY
ncbi:MAG TPA: cytochrome C oxidase subunit IV family protein [Pirellulales bacterium]|jgi:cytochrome c oxidase subunit 4|nr:cytochrome C oxidase subunit IV family protein [Pirellulales bacterium]